MKIRKFGHYLNFLKQQYQFKGEHHFLPCLTCLFLFLVLSSQVYPQNGAGSISGRVTDEFGAPIAEVTVRASIIEPHRRKDAVTDQDGYYKIEGLESENYLLRTMNDLGYVDEYYDNATNRQAASWVKINESTAVIDIDFQLGRGGFISGKVTDAESDSVQPNIVIHFINMEFNEMHGIAITDSAGEYISPALAPGEYVIKAFGVNAGFLPVFWPNEINKKDAARVAVVRDEVNPDKDFQLERGGTITGRIFETGTQTGVDSVWVVVLDSSQAWASQAWSENGGYYSAGGLRTGNYKVWIYEVDPWQYRAEYYDDASNFAHATWVPVELRNTTDGIDIYLDKVTTAIINNEIIEIAVTDKFPGTNLTVGTTGGLETREDDFQSLLNGHPRPIMSYTTFKIDKINYRFSSNQGIAVAPPRAAANGKSISRVWEIEGVEITQIAKIIPSDWASRRRDDTAMLEYVIINKDNADHLVGTRVLFDTKLGETDGAPIDIPYYGASNFEREFTEDNMPPWWTAKNIVDDKIIFSAQGTLKDYGATPPDRFVIARYSNIMPSPWDYDINEAEEYISDSAVAMWWEPQLMAPGDTLRVVTYYGLGEDTPDLEAPEVVNLNPKKNQNEVHPNTPVRFTIEDKKSGVDTTGIEIQINGEEADWETQGSLRELIFLCYPKQPFTFNQTEIVSIKNVRDNAPVPNVMEDVSYEFHTMQDNQPPQVIQVDPPDSAENIAVSRDIRIQLRDRPAGIDTTSLVFIVENDTIKPELSGDIFDLILSYTPVDSFPYSSQIDFSIRVSDLTNIPNELDSSFYFVTRPPVIPDSLAPVIHSLIPAPGDTIFNPRPRIEAQITDDYSGINQESIYLKVNSARVQPVLECSSKYCRVTYVPERRFNPGETIFIDLSVEDLARIPNQSDTSWYFTLFADTEPPLISDCYPAPGAKNIPLTAEIKFSLRDLWSGVDSNSVKLLVDNVPQAFNIAGDSTVYNFSYRPFQPWNFNQTVAVKIFAQDLASPPNVMNTVQWQFTTTAYLDTISPYTTGHLPAKNGLNVLPELPVTLHIKDDQIGVDSASIVMHINEQPVVPKISGGLRDYFIEADPKKSFDYNQTNIVSLNVKDLMGNPYSEIYHFATIIDTTAPFITDLQPAPNEMNVSTRVKPSFVVRDLVSGVNSNSLIVTLNSAPAVIRKIHQADGSYLVSYQAATQFKNGEQVKVTIQAADLAGNIMPEMTFEFQLIKNLPDLQVISLKSEPAGNLKMNVPFKIIASIKAVHEKVEKPFYFTFYQYSEILCDTLLQGLAVDSTIEISQVCQYPLGTYQFKAVVDSRDEIDEDREMNNIAELFLEVNEGDGQVRPNPFTPNGDGYNDEVQFNFTQLLLNAPQLKIFDFYGKNIRTILPEGNGVFRWNGLDAAGNQLSPGVYLYLLSDRKKSISKGYVVLAR